jgi:hypothetical protein
MFSDPQAFETRTIQENQGVRPATVVADMATNGSKWQLFGNILAAESQRIGSLRLPTWPLRAAEWQQNGNKWQQHFGVIVALTADAAPHQTWRAPP